VNARNYPDYNIINANVGAGAKSDSVRAEASGSIIFSFAVKYGWLHSSGGGNIDLAACNAYYLDDEKEDEDVRGEGLGARKSL